MPDKAVFVRSVLLCVQHYQGNIYFTTPKQHLVAKNELAFSFRPTRNLTDGQVFPGLREQQVGRQYADVSC